MTIYFDKTCGYWNNDNKLNEYYVNHTMDYMRELVKHRGYVYLNQIFEALGATWDTRMGNLCIEDENFTVVIGWDCRNDRWVIDIY